MERHHQIVRDMLHRIDAQCQRESLIVGAKDIVAETVYAKNNMLEIGGYAPITAAMGIRPSFLPQMDFESTSVAMNDDTVRQEAHFDRSSVRLREIAVRSMIEYTDGE